MNELTITINTKDIYFDVDAETLRQSRASGLGDVAADNIATDSTDDATDKAQIKRSADIAMGDVRAMLSEFIVGYDETANNTLAISATSYTITLRLSNRRMAGKAEALGRAIHNYIVNTALTRHYTSLSHPAAANYAGLAEAEKRQIVSLIYTRQSPAL